MYKVSLEQSYFSAQADTDFRALTIAKFLREQAGRAGSQVALREVVGDGSIGREWTYGRLLEDAERLGGHLRLAIRAALALQYSRPIARNGFC